MSVIKVIQVNPLVIPPGGILSGAPKPNIADVTGLQPELDKKQEKLVTGVNVKTVDGQSILGTGNIVTSATAPAPTVDSTPINGSVNLVTSGGVFAADFKKVDKVVGMGLSTNDFTNAYRLKLDSLTVGGSTGTADDAFLLNRTNHTGTQLAATISDLQTAINNNATVVAVNAAKHTHTNKTLLDSYTQTEINLADAVTKKHTHANLTALNAVTGTNTGDQDLSSFATTTALNTAVTNLKGGVVTAGDTLAKLYNLISGASTEVTVANITARNAYNVPSLPFNVFVTDDGDGNWALYKATTTGVNATYIKLNDYDNQNAVQTASQIKTAYESNPDTNAFTNALKTKLTAITGTNTGDQVITLTGDITGTGTGTFATSIGAAKVTNAMLAGSIASNKLVGTDITSLGTITTGTWQGTAIASTYITGAAAWDTHLASTANPHNTTKTQVGLSNVQNIDTTLRSNHTGTQSADTIIDGATNKVYTFTEKAKLAGIAIGATVNNTDAYLLDRANHTGIQAQSTVTNLTADLASKAPLASPALTGVPTAPTAVTGTNTTQLATTAYVIAERSSIATLTGKTLSGVNNAITAIPQASVTNLTTDLAAKQATLVSGTNIKTINGLGLVGSGNITVVDSATDTYTGTPNVLHIVSLTQVEYNAIATPDVNTLYYII